MCCYRGNSQLRLYVNCRYSLKAMSVYTFYYVVNHLYLDRPSPRVRDMAAPLLARVRPERGRSGGGPARAHRRFGVGERQDEGRHTLSTRVRALEFGLGFGLGSGQWGQLGVPCPGLRPPRVTDTPDPVRCPDTLSPYPDASRGLRRRCHPLHMRLVGLVSTASPNLPKPPRPWHASRPDRSNVNTDVLHPACG